MKFRISSKDLTIFIVFSIFLLYLCAIGVMNFVTFGAEGKPWGLNPFPAFSGVYLPVTLILYAIAMIMIFASVSSYIFEKSSKKGVGLDVSDKIEKGYSSWAKEKDIKEDVGVTKINYQAETVAGAGLPLIVNEKKKEMWVDNWEYHTVVIGASGSGKSQTVVKPMVNLLAKHGESMIITDPKGELYVSSANRLKELGYNVVVLNFREPLKGNAWNPLTLPYQYMKMGNKDKATELLDDVALNILYDPNNKGEPFWEKSAADFFSGLALGLFQDAKEEEINLNSISVMSTVGEERLGPSNYTKEYFTMKGESSPAYIFASNTINAPSDTKGGIMSTFRQKIRLFASRENLSEMLSHSDFNMLEIGKQKTAVFIVIHDEKTTYHALATIFIKQCYETLIDVAQENGGKLPIRTNFILDEFANMPPLKDVDSMVTAARSRQMRFTFIIQNFAQLNDVYGKEVAEVIRGNCGNTLYLISSELAALEEISKMCGEVKSKEKDKTASTPLVTVTDLQKFKMGEALLIRMRKGPFKTKLLFDWKTNWGYNKVDAEFPSRESKPLELFDIKAFVKEKKKELAEKEGNSNPMGGDLFNPFGGGMNPFANSNPFGGTSPFGLPESKPSTTTSPFGGNMDLDAMMKDIDRKLAELDAEEAKEKEEKMNSVSPMNVANTSSKDLTSQALESMEKEILPSQENNSIDLEKTEILDDLPLFVNQKQEDSSIKEDKVETNQPLSMMDDALMDSLMKEEPKDEITKDIATNDDLNLGNWKEPVFETQKEEKVSSLNTNNNLDTNKELLKEENKNTVLDYFNAPVEEERNVEIPNANTNTNEVLKSENKPIINVDIDKVNTNRNVISDDEFFDDFFGDDDF